MDLRKILIEEQTDVFAFCGFNNQVQL
jgi:hypothetical protein